MIGSFFVFCTKTIINRFGKISSSSRLVFFEESIFEESIQVGDLRLNCIFGTSGIGYFSYSLCSHLDKFVKFFNFGCGLIFGGVGFGFSGPGGVGFVFGSGCGDFGFGSGCGFGLSWDGYGGGGFGFCFGGFGGLGPGGVGFGFGSGGPGFGFSGPGFGFGDCGFGPVGPGGVGSEKVRFPGLRFAPCVSPASSRSVPCFCS